MKFKKLALSLAASVAAITFSPTVSGAQTGGAIIPCPGSPYGNGWFNTANYQGVQGSVNCSQQNNHIVVDVYNSQGVRTQAAIDMWYGSPCDRVSFIQGGGTTPFKIHLTNDSYGYSQSSGCGTHGVSISQNTAGTWTSGYHATLDSTINQCHVLQTRVCGSVNGFTTVRPRGINSGPYTTVYFSGYAGCWCANQFVTDVYPLVTS